MTEQGQFGQYATIYADPPWWESGGGQICRGAQRHYPLMKTPAICALPVGLLAAKNAHLYLWVTNNYLLDGAEVAKAWGFRYVTLITWAKDRIGLGQYFRGQTEHLMFCVRGSLPYRSRPDGKRAQGTTLLHAPRTEHSRKPEAMRAIIESVSHPPYIELFARATSTGWDTWGNEVENSVQMPDEKCEAQGTLVPFCERCNEYLTDEQIVAIHMAAGHELNANSGAVDRGSGPVG